MNDLPTPVPKGKAASKESEVRSRTPLDASIEREARREAEEAVNLPKKAVEEMINFSAIVPMAANDQFEELYFRLRKNDRSITKKGLLAALLLSCNDPEVIRAVVSHLV
jgi:hypothetical protein